MDVMPFAYFGLVAIAFDVRQKKKTKNKKKTKIQHQTLPRLLSMSFSHVSSRICMVSGLMFAFLIHLELIFVGSVR